MAHDVDSLRMARERVGALRASLVVDAAQPATPAALAAHWLVATVTMPSTAHPALHRAP